MLAVREYCELMEVFGQPWRGFGDVDKAVFDYRGLRMHTHRLLVGRVTLWQPSAIRSWISCVPEALSSISTTLALNRFCCSRTARLSAGYSRRWRNRPMRKRCLPLTPQVVHTEKLLSSVALLAVSQLCTMRSKHSGLSLSR